MSKLSMFDFIVRPDMVREGIQFLGLKGALLHALRKIAAFCEFPLMGPFQIRINPMGVICNHKCPMCWIQHLSPSELRNHILEDQKSRLSLEEYRSLFRGLPRGLSQINIVGGGEPLAHPDCIDIMREVKKIGLRGYLITNGSLLRDHFAEELLDIKWDLIRVSVHAGDRRTYQAAQGVDNFDLVSKNLTYFNLRRKQMAKTKCQLHLQNVLQKCNILGIKEMFRYAEELGVDYIHFELISPLSADQMLTTDQLKSAADSLLSCKTYSRIPCNLDRILRILDREVTNSESQTAFRPASRCSVGFDSAFITSDGVVKPCCFSDEIMGNVRENSFKAIWRGEKYSEFRKRLINGNFASYCYERRCKLVQFLHD